jgi:hypothetical protein
MPASRSTARTLVMALAASLLLATACTSSGDGNPAAATSPSRVATPSPSASPSLSNAPRVPVDPASLFRPLRGYRFTSPAKGIQKRARKSFRALIGPHLFAASVRRAVVTRPAHQPGGARRSPNRKHRAGASGKKRRAHKGSDRKDVRRHHGGARQPRGTRRRHHANKEPPEGTVVAISVELPPGETVGGFQTKVVEALSQETSSVLIQLGGHPAYFSKNATSHHLSRVYFFYKKTLIAQVFGGPRFARSLALAFVTRQS